MDMESSLAGSPTGGPLQAVTPDRINQLPDSSARSFRDSSVHEKITQFNSMSGSAHSRPLEKKAADALKRAALGREEAEADAKRYRDEARMLRKALEEGKDRERKVGERLEAVMENYGRAKETHAHTQALWEKEIRKARKETFKSQSTIVKSQEELKSARTTIKSLEDDLRQEKQRSQEQEQDAFSARYQIVGVQERLDEALERIKVVEQERDAYKTAAKNEEVARIAIEGRIPLPKSQPGGEFTSPDKNKKRKANNTAKVSLSTMDITTSLATEMEMEELSQQVAWERNRVERAQEMIEFLQIECQMNCCPCSKSKHRASLMASARERRASRGLVLEEQTQPEPESEEQLAAETEEEPEEEATQLVEYVEPPQVEMEDAAPEEPEEPQSGELDQPHMDEFEPPQVEEEVPEEYPVAPDTSTPQEPLPTKDSSRARSKKEPRRSTIFCPQEGVFRTVSEQEAMALEARNEAIVERDNQDRIKTHTPVLEEDEISEPEHLDEAMHEEDRNLRMYARTPSVEPPSFAVLGRERASLLSLLNAPQADTHPASAARIHEIPTMPDREESRAPHREEPTVKPVPGSRHVRPGPVVSRPSAGQHPRPASQHSRSASQHSRPASRPARPTSGTSRSTSRVSHAASSTSRTSSREPQLNASAGSYATITTTVPIKDENIRSSSTFTDKLRTPSGESNCSFDTNNPALTPTMTREEALAKIKERRGRARSAAQTSTTAGKKIAGAGLNKRDMSAPLKRGPRSRHPLALPR